MVRTRYQAFGIHLGISLAIFAACLMVLYFYWYPGFLFSADGGWNGVEILIGVDLVLGPLLTLIVYKHDKPHLKMDLTIIALIQFMCLAAGLWVIHSQRPLLIVYVDGQFYSISSRPYVEAHIKIPGLDEYPGASPKWVMVDLPENVFTQSDLRKQMLKSNTPLRLLTANYQPFSANEKFYGEAFDQEELVDRDRQRQAIPNWLDEHGGTLQDYAFFPFGARYTYAFVGFRRSNGEFVGLLDTPREETSTED